MRGEGKALVGAAEGGGMGNGPPHSPVKSPSKPAKTNAAAGFHWVGAAGEGESERSKGLWLFRVGKFSRAANCAHEKSGVGFYPLWSQVHLRHLPNSPLSVPTAHLLKKELKTHRKMLQG